MHVLYHVTQRDVPVVPFTKRQIVQAAENDIASRCPGGSHCRRVIVDALRCPSQVRRKLQERAVAATDVEKVRVVSLGRSKMPRITHIEIAPAPRQQSGQMVTAGKRVRVRRAEPVVQVCVGDSAPQARESRVRRAALMRVIALVGKADRGSVRTRVQVSAAAIRAAVEGPFPRRGPECVVLQSLVKDGPRVAAAKRTGDDSFKAGRRPFFESV